MRSTRSIACANSMMNYLIRHRRNLYRSEARRVSYTCGWTRPEIAAIMTKPEARTRSLLKIRGRPSIRLPKQ